MIAGNAARPEIAPIDGEIERRESGNDVVIVTRSFHEDLVHELDAAGEVSVEPNESRGHLLRGRRPPGGHDVIPPGTDVLEALRLDRLPKRLRRKFVWPRDEDPWLRVAGRCIWFALVWLTPPFTAFIATRAIDAEWLRFAWMILIIFAIVVPAGSRGVRARSHSAFEALRMPSRPALTVARWIQAAPWLAWAGASPWLVFVAITDADPRLSALAGITCMPTWLYLRTDLRTRDKTWRRIAAPALDATVLVWVLNSWAHLARSDDARAPRHDRPVRARRVSDLELDRDARRRAD